MELRNKLYTPVWRDPAYLKRRRLESRFRAVMASLTVVCALFLAIPDRLEYDRAISLQLAAGGWSARLLFAAMLLTLTYMAIRLWNWRQTLAAATSIAMTAGLAVIAFTNPASSAHNSTFVCVAVGICATLGLVTYRHQSAPLFWLTGLSIVGLVLCPFHIGWGERLLVASSCIAMNVVYYDVLDP